MGEIRGPTALIHSVLSKYFIYYIFKGKKSSPPQQSSYLYHALFWLSIFLFSLCLTQVSKVPQALCLIELPGDGHYRSITSQLIHVSFLVYCSTPPI